MFDAMSRLVLMVGVDDLDWSVEHFAAEIFDRHLGGFNGRFTTEIGIDAGLVVQDADLHLAVGSTIGEYGGAAGKQECHGRNEILSHMSLLPEMVRSRVCSKLASRSPQTSRRFAYDQGKSALRQPVVCS